MKPHDIYEEYVHIDKKLFELVDKAEQIDNFIRILKDWILKDLLIEGDPQKGIGRLRFTFGDKNVFYFMIPIDHAILLQRFLFDEND